MTIDGVLDEDAWRAAEPIDTFTQTEPSEGAPPSARTIVRVLAGPTAVAIGIMCDVSDPSGIVSFSVRRDAPLESEDHLRVVIGSFVDGRSGYVFAVNPSVARYDALIEPRLYSQFTWWFGEFYNGELDQLMWTGAWNPTRY